MIRPIISAFGLCAVLISAAPAAAQDTMSVPVSYADLNLGSNAGAQAFKQRIDNAVGQICGTADNADLARWAEVGRCKSQVMSRTRPDVEDVLAAAKLAKPFTEAQNKLAAR